MSDYWWGFVTPFLAIYPLGVLACIVYIAHDQPWSTNALDKSGFKYRGYGIACITVLNGLLWPFLVYANWRDR